MLRRGLIALIATVAIAGSSIPAVASGYLQCVPFARAESGIDIRGNALTWWSQAEGRYDRGQQPRVGAVMAFAPTRAMPIGHVAVVSQIVSEREVLISHSNWSPINGRRGQVERDVRALDVSAAGDVDILVTNAGGPPPGAWSDWSRDDFIRAMDGNMLTPIALMQALMPAMIAKGWGRVVNITS
ncbi:MAG: SDR family NAD(P)-dependent oxidoreductase, partial [Sphingomonadales bacterium]|nr:SDR family NAD(P)-dependent oxidoreductase [Sphingomonadales bacterium]